MKVCTMLGSAILGMSIITANAMAAGSRHYEGCVTQFTPSQMVVCTFESPLTCNIIKLYSGTRVSSNRRARPGRGEYVSVDASISASGQAIARSIRVYPGMEVRTIQGFQAGQAQQVASRLANIPGVSNVRINTQLGEALISFRTGVTTPAAITRRAARNGVRLSLPG